MTELKSCPLCGGDNIGIIQADIILGTQYWKIHCYECGCTQTPVSNKEDAIENWNTRHNPWHTGTPTEEGLYIIAYKTELEGNLTYATAWVHGGNIFYCQSHNFERKVVAWMPIPPLEAST